MEERKQHFERPTMQRQPSMVSYSLLTVVLALASGFGGFLLARNFFPVDNTNYPILGNDRNININIEQPLTNIASKYQDKVAGIYKNQNTLAQIGQPLFADADYLGAAVVVTSDGWLMTTDQTNLTEDSLVTLGDKIYSVEDVRADKFSRITFLRIDATALSPVDFQLTDDLREGEKIFAQIDEPGSITHSFLSGELNNAHLAVDKYLSTDSLDYYIEYSDQYSVTDHNMTAVPYFNLQGAILGLAYQINDQSVLIPAEYLRQSVRHLLNNTVRPTLGLRYIDMENHTGFLQKGNLVYAVSGPAVLANTPASKAGLRSLDQIVAVNNDVISQKRTLTSIIQSYRVGDTVILKVLRGGAEVDISVTL